MNQEAILHVPYGAYAYALSEHQARVTLRAKRGEIRRCSIVHEDRYAAKNTYDAFVLDFRGSDALYDYFQGDVPTVTRRIRYRFLLEDDATRMWYGEQGCAADGESAGWFQLAYLCTRDLFTVPDWVDNAIVYQIFPDRFYNGDQDNDPEGVLSWGEQPTAHTFFGGDLEGIIGKLSYLEQLGINLLYMTPIFRSPSTHKYDTTDYMTIDPMFGDIATCKRLVDEAHAKGIRVLFDAVFNHCGSDFPPFRDVLEHGEASQYANWFHIHGFPVDPKKVNYETFANGIASMPKLRTEHPEVRTYLLHVAEFWVKEVGIDGWRLDVANEVDHAFWREFRDVVRAANPQALIIGEVWHDASPWLQGDQFDGVMNYLFRDAVIDFFAKGTIDAQGFDARLTRTRMMYKEQANRSMFNLLGSHDTARFLTVCREQEARMRLAVIFQMTYVGIPEIYYGDEVGMRGETDPDCRRTMVWNEEEQHGELLALHRKLIALRKQHSALQCGSYRTVVKDALNNVYAFAREDGREAIYIVLNNGAKSQSVALTIEAGIDLLSGELCGKMIVLEPFGAKMIRVPVETASNEMAFI